MSKITCPHCHSENVKTFRMVFESGTAVAVHDTTGIGLGSGGTVGVGAAQTTSTSVTTLAASVAPPETKKVLGFAGIGAVGALAVFFGIVDGKVEAIVVGALLAIAGGYEVYKNCVWNQSEHPKLVADWERSWKCLACGAAFAPDGGAPALPRAAQAQRQSIGLGRFIRFLK